MKGLPPNSVEPADSRFEDYFRDGVAPFESQALWQLAQHDATLDALRGLFHGPAPLVRLRVWVFMELMSVPQSRISRDEINHRFHTVREEPLTLVLGRLREVGLLLWEATTQDYGLPPLAPQVMALLSPLMRAQADDADLAGLLASVAGAQQVGLVEPAQLLHLQAQLARLHDEFAEAIASGSEFRLRQARRRFDRALTLVERASQALTAIITGAQGDVRLERVARELGLAQARLLAMASQFNRAMQQADRQRVTLGSTGVTTTDVRRWLQSATNLALLLEDVLSAQVQPVFVTAHELLDVAEAEFERDRPSAIRGDALPPPQTAPVGTLERLSLPIELDTLVAQLASWTEAHPVADALLGGRYAQAAYRAQLMPLLGDPQAQELQGRTGDAARAPWRVQWSTELVQSDDLEVRALSAGWLLPEGSTASATLSTEDPSIP